GSLPARRSRWAAREPRPPRFSARTVLISIAVILLRPVFKGRFYLSACHNRQTFHRPGGAWSIHFELRIRPHSALIIRAGVRPPGGSRDQMLPRATYPFPNN